MTESIQERLTKWAALFQSLTDGRAQAKLPEEMQEFLEAVSGTEHKLEEGADVVIVVLTQLTTEGFTLVDLLEAVDTKLLVNLERRWKRHADGTVSHVKEVL